MSLASKPDSIGFLVIGTNHRQAPVEFRERVAFVHDEMLDFLRRAHESLEHHDCFMLSTCNRTEIYAFHAGLEGAGDRVRRLIGEFKAVDAQQEAARSFYEYHGRAALEQLFRVACGLDSQVLGEAQILQQVKTGYDAGLEAASLGVVGEHLLEAAIRCGKRARAETSISSGAVSVAFAAVSLAHKVHGDLAERAALVVGAGVTGALVAKHLRDHGIGRLLVANRGLDRARALAAEMRGEPLGLDGVAGALPHVDVVITATSAPQPLIDPPMVRAAMKARQNRSFLFVDIGVPRDVDPEVRRIDNVFLHDVDGLQVMIEQALQRRRREVPKVEKIVAQEVDHFLEWYNNLQAGPVIKELRGWFELLREQEIARHASHLSGDQRQAVELVTRSLLNKILHRPTVLLRESTATGAAGLRRIEVVRELFGLDRLQAGGDATQGGGGPPPGKDRHDEPEG
jgi:glutamyl-tRNA reductase